jgi:hypothetical protein
MNESYFVTKYEFRIFDQSFSEIEKLVKQNSKKVKEQNNVDIYLLTAADSENNVKMRNGIMDMKILEETVEGFERWNQYMIGNFPMSNEIILNTVFPSLGVPAPTFSRSEYTMNQFLNELVYYDPDIFIAHTVKHHKKYLLNNCEVEITDLLINMSYIKSVCIESEDLESVKEVKKFLKISSTMENVNYPKGIKRVMGLEHLPEHWKNKMYYYFKKTK